MKKHLNNEKLVEDFKRGGKHKQTAFKELVHIYGPTLFAQIYRIVNNVVISEDILQEVFMKIYHKLDQFKGDSQLYTWLYSIARNHTLNKIKQENRYKSISIDQHQFQLTTDLSLKEDTILKVLDDGIKTLPDQQKIIFELYYFEKKTHKAIAELLNISEGGSKSNYFQAKKKLLLFFQTALNY